MRSFQEVLKPLQLNEDESKMRHGLRGLANNSPVLALADTGAGGNVVSESFVTQNGLRIEGSSTQFRLGNDASVNSIGNVFKCLTGWQGLRTFIPLLTDGQRCRKI